MNSQEIIELIESKIKFYRSIRKKGQDMDNAALYKIAALQEVLFEIKAKSLPDRLQDVFF
jgi:hypothetical protein